MSPRLRQQGIVEARKLYRGGSDGDDNVATTTKEKNIDEDRQDRSVKFDGSVEQMGQ